MTIKYDELSNFILKEMRMSHIYQPERNAIQKLLEEQRKLILEEDCSVVGFNVGNNIGEAAGQTVMHCHTHLIPRREGDVAAPKGGVRGVIPSKQSY
jgi:diadenosine tetraphosphate (Ap4A) HIT family hydrolase